VPRLFPRRFITAMRIQSPAEITTVTITAPTKGASRTSSSNPVSLKPCSSRLSRRKSSCVGRRRPLRT
jgi:hypothetical protein